jgi:hypothetical protein
MLKLALRYHDGYTLRFAYYALVKAARSFGRPISANGTASEKRELSREPAERISA